ncbi:MAG: replication protein [Caldilineaceae bacterium]
MSSSIQKPLATFVFTGFISPNYTQVPDQFFDELLPILSGNETKVLLYIFRRTFGFKKGSDNISLSQMVSGITSKDGTQLDNGTGLSKASIARALKDLEEKNVIIRVRRSDPQKEIFLQHTSSTWLTLLSLTPEGEGEY